jgi:predicted anti-sigma-YlaC factor YlaD
MHRLIRDRLEQLLESNDGAHLEECRAHLEECEECRAELDALREQRTFLLELRAPEDLEPHPGFYARVMERIEPHQASSMWNLFFESPFGRRIAVVSMAAALFLSVYLVASERLAEQPLVDQPGLALTQAGAPDRDSVLVNLVTYREQ